MPVAAGPPYPSLSYHTTDRRATYGFASRYSSEVRQQQVYTESRAERARTPNPQRSYHTYPSRYTYTSGYSRSHHAPQAGMRSSRRRSSTARTQVAFHTPRVPSFPAGPDSGYSTRRARSPPRNYSTLPQAAPERQVRFQSPQSCYRYTPAPSFPTSSTATTTTTTPAPMRMPEPQPYPVNTPNPTPQYSPYQYEAQVMPFPDPRYSKPLPPTPPSSSALGTSSASTYGSPYSSSSGTYYSSGSSSRSSRTRYPLRRYRITPSVFGSSASSTYGSSSSNTPSTFSPPRRKKDRAIPLRKASEKMADFKRVVDAWTIVIKRNRREKLTEGESAVVSLVRDLRQISKQALDTIDVILASISAYEGIGNGSPFSSEKLNADTSALATMGTSLHHKLAGLTRRLKNAEAIAGQTEPPSSLDCCTRIMDFPSCIANLYLKKRLFRFTSLLKAQREQYSGLDSGKPVQFGPYAPPISTLIGALYAEVQRTYNTATAALAGFETSLRTFQLDLQSQANNRYLPVAIG